MAKPPRKRAKTQGDLGELEPDFDGKPERESDVLIKLGQVAGIGGISVGVLFLLFREFIRQEFFPNLDAGQAYNLLLLFMLFTFAVAIAGLATWASQVKGGGRAVVGLLLVFALAMAGIGAYVITSARESAQTNSQSTQGSEAGRIDYERTADLSQVRCLPDGRKYDVVVLTDTATFISGDVPTMFRRPYQVTTGAKLEVQDLVEGGPLYEVSRRITAGAEDRGEVSFLVDPKAKQARFKWIWTNGHGSSKEGIGFSSVAPYVFRHVDVRYVPEDIALKNRTISDDTPNWEVRDKCVTVRGGFRCENLLVPWLFRETWEWDVWSKC